MYLGFAIYHNQSNVLLGDSQTSWKKEEIKSNSKKIDVESTKPVWNYDPKNAGKSTFSFGSEKPDYRKKDEVNKERTPTTITNNRKKWSPFISL